MSKSSSATLPKAVAPAQERKPLAPLPPQQRNGSYTNEDFSDTASGDSSLEGNVQLRVLLPDGTSVFMAVERRMPVMDLLVHIATAQKLSPGSHQINFLNAQDNVLGYKASTPIGSLNTSSVQLVPKRNDVPNKKVPKQIQPFEQTFRLQVHLPHQQLFVIRVSSHARLSDIFNMVCQQKELDPNRYSIQHPTSPELQLDLSRTLADYSLTEINVISKRGSIAISSRHSANVELNRVDEEKKGKSLFGLKFRRNKSSVGDSSSDEYNSRGCSPARTQPDQTPEPQIPTIPPKKTTKKRAAPLPPTTNKPQTQERPPPPPPLHPKSTTTTKNHEINEQSHSRHSSDSSGYHESSVLGDECLEIETARSASNLSSTASTSTTSILSGIKKRRAPQPPKKVEVVVGVEVGEASTSELKEEVEEELFESLPLSCDSSIPESPSPNARLEPGGDSSAELAPSDELVIEGITEEPEPVLELTLVTEPPRECHDPSLLPTSGTTSHEHPSPACDEIDLPKPNFCFDPDITIDKYREEETSGSCSRSDTHTTDSAVADLDLDASGSTTWSPVPEVKQTSSKEISVTAVVHYEEREVTRSEKEVVEEPMEIGVWNDEFDGSVERKEDLLPKVESVEDVGRYDWFSSSRALMESHDEWIKSSSEDEHETLEAPSSPSSYYSADDVAASFEQVIADAEFAMKKQLEEEEKSNPKPAQNELAKIVHRRTRPLVNFSIDTYKSRNDNDPSKIFDFSETLPHPEPAVEENHVSRSSSIHEKAQTQNIQFKMAPYPKLDRQMSLDEEEAKPKPNLSSKSKSMFDLLDDDVTELKKTKSEQKVNFGEENLSNVQNDSPEYLKLQEEYAKFQQQLVYWQQQLMSNQALLQQQHIVPPNSGFAPGMLSLVPGKLEKENSVSVDNLDETDGDARKRENPVRINEQQKAKSCVDLSPQPIIAPKVEEMKMQTRAPLFRVESMKKEENFWDEPEPEPEVVKEKEAVLPSIKDRISLFLGKKSENGGENGSMNGNLARKEEIVKNNNFERGLMARKAMKMSHSCNGESKFRRQRITPTVLAAEKEKEEVVEKSKPVCNGHVVRDARRPDARPVEVGQLRKPKAGRPMIFTYFGDTVNDKESAKSEKGSTSVVTKVATSEVLAKPNFAVLTSVERGPPKVSSKPVKKSSAVNGGNKFGTAPSSRDTLMDSIREFGGRKSLKKVPKSETYWHSWHGEVA